MDHLEFLKQLKIGDEIPSLRKEAILESFQLSEIFGGIELATESDKAKEKADLLGVDTIHMSKVFGGPFMLQFLSEMITNWLPDIRGWVQGGKLSAKFVRLVKFNEIITCKGVVKDKMVENNRKYVIFDVWVENISGDKVVIGEAHISF